MLLVAFFFSLVLLVASPQGLAVDVGQLEDVTGGVVPVVTLEGHDTFTNEYIYSVKVINQTGDPLVAGRCSSCFPRCRICPEKTSWEV